MTREIDMYQVDAFTDRPFSGNPAAVCPLDAWLEEETMQAIAAENNLAETAFIVPEGEDYRIRWFTPTVEIDLCGHATLASGHVIFKHLDPARDAVRFESRSGPLFVTREDDWITLDFPSQPPVPRDGVEVFEEAIGQGVKDLRQYQADGKRLALLESEAAVRNAELDMDLVKKITVAGGGLIITAPGEDCDFVSRYFTPNAGIPEDPVTGSAHSVLTPYWAEVLGKTKMEARQISKRGGRLRVELKGERVLISGQSAAYLQGRISV